MPSSLTHLSVLRKRPPPSRSWKSGCCDDASWLPIHCRSECAQGLGGVGRAPRSLARARCVGVKALNTRFHIPLLPPVSAASLSSTVRAPLADLSLLRAPDT
eukprot:scaffold76197_cov64-Phaeocystis_antarctica.AAC.3